MVGLPRSIAGIVLTANTEGDDKAVSFSQVQVFQPLIQIIGGGYHYKLSGQ